MKTFSYLLLLALSIPMTGCINLSFGSRKSPPPPTAPAIVVQPGPLTPADAATISEIDAAAKLSFDSAKTEALIQVAQRPALNPAVQVHLVNVTYRSLSSDNPKMHVLRTLIANPAFGDPARQAIVTQLDRLSFDSHKQSILRHLNERVTASQGAATRSATSTPYSPA